jgi:PAS domain S-box-containing protein
VAQTRGQRGFFLCPLRDPGVSAHAPDPHEARSAQEPSEETTTIPVEPERHSVARLPSWLRRLGYYGLALFLVAAAALLRWELSSVLKNTPFLVFYPAWVGAAAFGGLGPGLLATVASWLCIDIFFDSTLAHIGFDDPASVGRLLVFLAGGLAVSLAGETMRRARLRRQRQARELAAANAALADSRRKYRGLVEKINDWVWEMDADCVYTYSSPRVRELLGYAPEEIVGKTPFDFMLPAEAQRVWNAFHAVYRDRKPLQQLENTLVRKDGRLVTVETSGMPMFAADGSFRGYTGVDRDVTGRRQAEQTLRESEKRFHQLFQEDLTGDFLCTPEGRILVCNPAFAALFGFSSADEVVGTSMWELYVDPGERDALLAALRRHGKLGRYEAWRKRRDGTPIHVMENLVGHFDDQGQLYEIQGYIFDDTERKRAEEALRELNMTLENKVAQRTVELEQRARQLQKLTLELTETEERERERVAAVLHDDLQQVLAAAKFQVSLLSNGTRGPDQAQEILGRAKEMLQDAIEKSRHLSHELSPGVLRRDDLAETFDWLAEQMQAKHGLTVRVEAFGAVPVRSDAVKTLLYRAAQEMLFNVVKHAAVPEARLRVRRRGRYLCLSVSDQGRGFDLREVRKTAGLGLLSIRERVALLGGRMKTRSAPGQGTTFRLIVPDAESRPNGAPIEQEATARAAADHPL